VKLETHFEKLRDELKKNGLVYIRNFISEQDSLQIRSDIEKHVERDLLQREKVKQIHGRFEGDVGITHNNSGKHIITDFFGRSLKLDESIGRLFDDQTASKLFEFIGGKNLKLRGYNTRRMNGPINYSAMEWHRDNVGEFTIGIVLSEQGNSNDSATCYIPESHTYPYCPFTSAQFAMPAPAPARPIWERFFSSMLEKKTTALAKDAVGKPGDIYIFMGDLWHGRRPNYVGNNDVVFFIGLFPSEVPFPSHANVDIPADDILAKLPLSLRRVVDFRNTPENKEKTSYFYELQKQKQTYGFLSLWNLAKLETLFWKSANLGGNKYVKKFIAKLERMLNPMTHFCGRIVRKIQRSF
jgi:hypothetical protein